MQKDSHPRSLMRWADHHGAIATVGAQVGWAYWTDDHWHLCADEPTAWPLRRPVFVVPEDRLHDRVVDAALVVGLMEKVDEYAEAAIWEAGYELPRSKAVELTRQRRTEVVRCLRSLGDEHHPTEDA